MKSRTLLIALALVSLAAARVAAQDPPPLERVIILAPVETPAQRATHVALGAYITAAFLDASETSFCYGRRSCYEANPLLRPIAEDSHIVTAMAVKGAMHAGIAAGVLHLHRTRPRAAFWIAIGLTAAQVAVDAINIQRGALR